MFYLMMHSTHFMVMGVVKYHSANEKGYPLMQLHGLLFLIRSNFLFFLFNHPYHRQDSIYHGFFYTSCGKVAEYEKWLSGVRPMVKDHSDSEREREREREKEREKERGEPLLPPHGLLFSISRKGSFICTISQIG